MTQVNLSLRNGLKKENPSFWKKMIWLHTEYSTFLIHHHKIMI